MPIRNCQNITHHNYVVAILVVKRYAARKRDTLKLEDQTDGLSEDGRRSPKVRTGRRISYPASFLNVRSKPLPALHDGIDNNSQSF